MCNPDYEKRLNSSTSLKIYYTLLKKYSDLEKGSKNLSKKKKKSNKRSKKKLSKKKSKKKK